MDVPEPDGSTAWREQVVLVVDDEADIRESLQELFASSLKGTRVLTADSGAAGLAVLKQEPVDLIVTDYKMPGMNGLEFLAEAKKIVPKVPRILVTAFPDLELAIRAVNEARIENFFTKPLEPGKVVEVIQGILNEKRSHELRDRSFARSLDLLRRKPATK